MLTGPGTERDVGDATQAVCALKVTKHSNHFPHAMQQFYQCWSYFNLPENAHKDRILAIPIYAKGFPGERLNIRERWNKLTHPNWNGFLNGFTAALSEATNVTVVRIGHHHRRDAVLSQRAVWRSDGAHTFYMRSPDDARALTAAIVQRYELQATMRCQQNSSSSSSSLLPRVAIVNRGQSRSLLNVDSLVVALRSNLGLEDIRTTDFERATFLEQVEFLANTDILLSPHGAQLTGIPFLPACGRVLEIFPARYFYHTYFGSLADAAGVASYPLYLSAVVGEDPIAEWRNDAQSLTSV